MASFLFFGLAIAAVGVFVAKVCPDSPKSNPFGWDDSYLAYMGYTTALKKVIRLKVLTLVLLVLAYTSARALEHADSVDTQAQGSKAVEAELRDASAADQDCVVPIHPDYSLLDFRRFGEPDVFRCLLRTAKKGENQEALEWAQILLWEGKIGYGSSTIGGLFPRSEARLKQYVDLGVARGSSYSLLAKAAYLQDVDPVASLELYRRVALRDDCRGQIMLARMYQQELGTNRNDALAYFWARLAKRQSQYSFPGSRDKLTSSRPVPYFERRVTAIQMNSADIKWEKKHYCNDLDGLVDTTSMENARFAEEVHEALLQWKAGLDAPEALARFAHTSDGTGATLPPAKAKNATAKPRLVRPAQNIVALPAWRPVTARFAPPARQARQLEDLYGELSRSVYVIVAGPTATDIKLRRNLAQGSAVAVDSSTLITNCHIVDSRPLVYLVNQDGLVPLAIAAARRSGDTCILRAQKDILSAVARIRPFDSLKVGEGVMAIGSPHGFEATLTVGIVSQLRRRGEQRLVQTTAPISGGSSGGGLFDYGGNLVGITTFSIRDAENLNFAISVDEYLR